MTEMPTIHAQVIMDGDVVGEIAIESNGSFSGEFTYKFAHRKIIEFLVCGLADGVVITTNNIPAKPHISE